MGLMFNSIYVLCRGKTDKTYVMVYCKFSEINSILLKAIKKCVWVCCLMHSLQYLHLHTLQSPYRAEAQKKPTITKKEDLKAAAAKRFKLVLSNGKIVR